MITIVQPIAQATIEFIGIILFTTQPVTPAIFTTPPNTPTLTTRTVSPAAQPNQSVNAVARVGNDVAVRQAAPQQNNVALAQDVVAILPPMPNQVEPHTPLIAFPTADFIDASGWTRVDLGRDGLSYIVLSTGDQVTFQTGARNPPIAGPKNLPHLKSELAALQRFQGFDLKAGYKAPAYSLAAVVKLSEGVLQECSSAAHGGRADTHVTLNTNGTLVIASGSKRLRLRTNQGDRFTIANIPLTYAISPTNTMSNHYLAYCAMLNVTPASCPMPQPNAALQACLGTGNAKTNPATLGGSADCSNTSWP